jgi:hypothetical protein
MIGSGLRTNREAQTAAHPSASESSSAIHPGTATACRTSLARSSLLGPRSVARAWRPARSMNRRFRISPRGRPFRSAAPAGWRRTGRPCAWARDAAAPEPTRLVALLAVTRPAGTEKIAPTVPIAANEPSCAAVAPPRRDLGSGASAGTTTRPTRGPGSAAPAPSTGAVVAVGGLDASGAGVDAGGGGAGSDAGCSAAGGGCGASGGGLDAGGAAGAGGGLGALRGGSNPSGSTYVSLSPTLIPRWTYGTSCSASPDGPGSAIAAPSATAAPLCVRSVPRCVRETLYPSAVAIVTVRPWVGTVPAKDTRPEAGARIALDSRTAMSRPRCCPAAYASLPTENVRRTGPSAGQAHANAGAPAHSAQLSTVPRQSTHRVVP